MQEEQIQTFSYCRDCIVELDGDHKVVEHLEKNHNVLSYRSDQYNLENIEKEFNSLVIENYYKHSFTGMIPQKIIEMEERKMEENS